MAGPGDSVLAAVVLAAVACVLAAPVLGRAGHAGWADAAMAAAALLGVVSFGIAGLHTFRAARRTPSRDASHREGE